MMTLADYEQRLQTASTIAALSIRQPFLTAIMHHTKTIEVRGQWIVVNSLSNEGIIALHASQLWYGQRTKSALQEHSVQEALHETFRHLDLPSSLLAPQLYPRGGVVGLARLTRCIEFTPTTWQEYYPQHRSTAVFNKRIYGYVLEDVVPLPTLIDQRGTLGIFTIPIAKILQALA